MNNWIFPKYLKIGCYYYKIIMNKSIYNKGYKFLIDNEVYGNFNSKENKINIKNLYKLSNNYKSIHIDIQNMRHILLHEILHGFDYFFNNSIFKQNEFFIDEISKHLNILFTSNTHILNEFSKDLFSKYNNILNIFPITIKYMDEDVMNLEIIYDDTNKEKKIKIDDYILPYFKFPTTFDNSLYSINSNILELICFQLVNISNSFIKNINIEFKNLIELSKMLYLFLIDNPEFINMYKNKYW